MFFSREVYFLVFGFLFGSTVSLSLFSLLSCAVFVLSVFSVGHCQFGLVADPITCTWAIYTHVLYQLISHTLPLQYKMKVTSVTMVL